MKITANIATQPSRLSVLPMMLDSIYPYFDVIRIYLNGFEEAPGCIKRNKVEYFYNNNDLTDNGKFFFIPEPGDPDEYYFTLDDDIIYPRDYVARTLANIQKYPGHIIAYHGRKLSGTGLKYYTGHFCNHIFGGVPNDNKIDVAGTGCTAWNTRDFKPVELWNTSYNRMSDLVLSLEAAKMQVPIMCCEHRCGWFAYLDPPKSIAMDYLNKPTPEQDYLSDSIYILNNP